MSAKILTLPSVFILKLSVFLFLTESSDNDFMIFLAFDPQNWAF